MEASWNRIRTISGAETAEDVIMYWEGLKAKEEQSCHDVCAAAEGFWHVQNGSTGSASSSLVAAHMRELVRLAENREAAAKGEIAKLLESRASM
eukprot:1150259-Pelagomonas_calceolata.AAC.6